MSKKSFLPAVPHKKRPAALRLLAVIYILSPSFGGERVHSERVPPPPAVCPVLRVAGQIIHGKLRHQRGSLGKQGLVDRKLFVVVVVDHAVGLVPTADEAEHGGNFRSVVGEVLAAHHGGHMAERLLAEELDHGLLGDFCEVIVIVDHGMHHMGILEHSLHAQTLRRVLHDLPHGLLVLIQEVGTSDALHGDMIGDRVVAVAAGDGSDGEHHGVQGVAHAGDILLEVIDDRRSAGDGIRAQMGRGRMGGGTNHIHREAAGVGHAGTGGNVDIGNVQRAPDMLAEDGVHTVQRALCDHSLRAETITI